MALAFVLLSGASIALAATALPPAALAQSGTPSLLSVKVSGDGEASDTVTLTFDRAPPAPTVVSNDNTNPVIAFPQTGGTPNLSALSTVKGLWHDLKIAQQGGSLALSLSAPGPVRLVVSVLSPTTLRLSLASASGSAPPVDTAPARAAAMISAPGVGAADEVFVVVPLKYADISEVVGILTDDQTVRPNDSFTPQEPAFGSAGIGSNNAPTPTPTILAMNPGADSPSPSLGRAINANIGIDRRLNAIILRGAAEDVNRLREKIQKIDVPVQSVILETVFVELTETGAKNVGVDLTNTNAQVVSATYGVGTATGVSGLTHGLLSVSLQGAIYAQVLKGEGRIISRPKISAQSGSSAKIITGDALPILTNITLSGVNGVSQQVQYVTVGVTLQIAPRVTEDGFVSSHIFCEVSSVTGYSQGYPTISQREASTAATVADGQSFIMGGLTQESDLSSSSRPPVVGGLPLVGDLLNHQTRSAAKTQLYIVVTPHIVQGNGNSGADALKLAEAPPELRGPL